jgi:UDP-N-acetylmuramoylalanine--D-glutamate ligase
MFSRSAPTAHALVRNRELEIKIPESNPFRLNLERCPLKGPHNEENISAAVLAAALLGVDPTAIQRAIDGYPGLPHRLEWVRNWRGVDFFDDSKATNVGAVQRALDNFSRPVLLLVGGRDKLGSYDPLGKSIRNKGKGVFTFGEAGPRLCHELGKWFGEVSAFPDLKAAFGEALKYAEPDDIVLLSPACSSFDQYTSYAQRGDHFKSLVNEL